MDVESVNILPGRTTNSCIIHVGDGYYYNVKEIRPRRIRLKCRHYSTGCRGSASLFLGVHGSLQLRGLQNHTCERDDKLPDDIEARATLVQEASKSVSGASVRKLLRDFRLKLHPDLASRFTVARMHSSLYRARCANYPTIPKTLVYLGVLLGLPNLRPICKTLDGEDYIFQGVIGVAMNKTVGVVFASGRQIQFLQSRKNLHMDGTFKKRPRKPKCRQIYNIVTRFETCIIALVRVLMQSRSQEAYLTLFRFIKELAPNLQPRRIHCDFERATINALRVVFPGTSIVGCLWHFGVCIGIQANKKQLAPLAAKNDLVHSFIRCLSGAALLPPGLIVDGVEEIWRRVEAAGWSEQFEPFFQYFRREWYPRKYELSVFNHDERTNNCSESDNRSMATAIPQNHPNVWFLIGGFVQLEHITWSDKIAVQKGKAVQAPRRWKTIANDLRVSRLSRLLVKEEMSPGQFLEAASWVNEGALKHGLNIKPDDVTDSDSDSD